MEASMRIPPLALSFLLLSALPVSATGLETPWEIALGPEKVLWIPEPLGSGVSQIDLDAEIKSAALAIDDQQ